MNRFVLILAWLFVALASTQSHADIAGEDFPSMGKLANLLSTTDPTEVEDNVYDEKGKISAGMISSDTTRGENCRNT